MQLDEILLKISLETGRSVDRPRWDKVKEWKAEAKRLAQEELDSYGFASITDGAGLRRIELLEGIVNG